MFIFKKLPDETNQFDVSEVTLAMQGEGHSLTAVLEEFEAFLKACGYHFNGRIDIVEEE